jgi:hypothetical protein
MLMKNALNMTVVVSLGGLRLPTPTITLVAVQEDRPMDVASVDSETTQHAHNYHGRLTKRSL